MEIEEGHDDNSDVEDIFLDARSSERDTDSISEGTVEDLLGDTDSDTEVPVPISEHSNQGVGNMEQHNVLLTSANFSDSLNDLLDIQPDIILEDDQGEMFQIVPVEGGASDNSDPEYDGDSEQGVSDHEEPYYETSDESDIDVENEIRSVHVEEGESHDDRPPSAELTSGDEGEGVPDLTD